MPTVTFEEVYANAYVHKSIDVIIRKTVISYPMTESHADDFRQQLWIAVNNALKSFNSKKSSLEHYLRVVMEQRLKNLLRCFFSSRSIKNRTGISIEYLAEIDSTVLSEPTENPVRFLDMKMDVNVVITSLPADQQEVCNAILSGKTWRNLASKQKMPHTTFFQRFILPIREAFQKENLENYLRN